MLRTFLCLLVIICQILRADLIQLDERLLGPWVKLTAHSLMPVNSFFLPDRSGICLWYNQHKKEWLIGRAKNTEDFTEAECHIASESQSQIVHDFSVLLAANNMFLHSHTEPESSDTKITPVHGHPICVVKDTAGTDELFTPGWITIQEGVSYCWAAGKKYNDYYSVRMNYYSINPFIPSELYECMTTPACRELLNNQPTYRKLMILAGHGMMVSVAVMTVYLLALSCRLPITN